MPSESLSTGNSPEDVSGLTRKLAAGDEAAFTEFHGRYFARLYQFLLVVARGNEDEAQEALQQTLLRVLRYARPFDTEEAFWGWLKVLARSAARDAGRKQRRYFALLQAFAAREPPGESAQAPVEESRLRSVLAEVMEELSAQDARLVSAKYIEGATIRELASAGGTTEKAVESRLLRLRRELRERIIRKLHTL